MDSTAQVIQSCEIHYTLLSLCCFFGDLQLQDVFSFQISMNVSWVQTSVWMQNATTLLAATPADLASQVSFLEMWPFAVSFACIYYNCWIILQCAISIYHSMHKWWHQADEWNRAISAGGQSGDLLQQCLWQHLWWLLGHCWCKCGVQTVGI